jgi:hypothetical protein
VGSCFPAIVGIAVAACHAIECCTGGLMMLMAKCPI